MYLDFDSVGGIRTFLFEEGNTDVVEVHVLTDEQPFGSVTVMPWNSIYP